MEEDISLKEKENEDLKRQYKEATQAGLKLGDEKSRLMV